MRIFQFVKNIRHIIIWLDIQKAYLYLSNMYILNNNSLYDLFSIHRSFWCCLKKIIKKNIDYDSRRKYHSFYRELEQRASSSKSVKEVLCLTYPLFHSHFLFHSLSLSIYQSIYLSMTSVSLSLDSPTLSYLNGRLASQLETHIL